MSHCNLKGWRLLWQMILLGLLASTAPLHGQEGALRFDRLTVEDGLSYSTLWSMYQDRQGFMWLGTGEGLNRYDGYRFKIYRHDPEDPTSLSESGIVAITEDLQGRLWLGTSASGLNCYHRSDDSFLRFRHEPSDPSSLSDDQIFDLLVTRDGTLWVATAAGLDRFDAEAERFERNPHLESADAGEAAAHGPVFELLEDREGVLWLGSEQGLGRFDPRNGSFTRFSHDPDDPASLSHDTVFELAQDAQGDLWIATGGGLNRLDRLTGRFERYTHDPDAAASVGADSLSSLVVDSEGSVWIGTTNRGLSRLDPATQRFTHHRHDASDPRSLISDLTTELHVDRSGLLWVGSYSGISTYDLRRNAFSIYRRQQWRQPTLSGVSAWAVTQDRSGAIWIGTDQGLDRLDRQAGTIDSYLHDPERSEGLQSGPIATLLEDRNGTLWIGTWGGLSRMDARRRELVHVPSHDPDDPTTLSSDLIQYLFEDQRGRLWVGTLSGLNLLERDTPAGGSGGRATRFPAEPEDPEALAEATIYAILEDRVGAIWIGTRTHGLFRFEDTGEPRFTQFSAAPDHPSSLSSNNIASLHQDRSGSLWVGTIGGGLNRFDAERGDFTRYREGLPSDSIIGILEDQEGRLWLSTHSGISRFDPQTETFRNYDSADGLASNDNAMVSTFQGLRGEMFFGSVGGLTAFFPHRVRDDEQPPPVVLTDFRLFNRSVPPRTVDPDSPLEGSILDAREITLSHRDYVFGFEFAALHFVDPRQNRYAYRLEGFDRDWIETDASQRFAQYSNLAAGDYVFRVRASNDDGIWNEEGVSLALRVLPPPWKTWWAYTLYFLALAAVIYAYVRWQERKVERERAINHRLREVDRLKDEFLANTSHELRTPLYGIVGIAESLIDGAAGEPSEEIRSNLEMVVASGRRLGSLINDILDFSRLTGKSLELQRLPVDLRALVDVVLNLSRPLIGAKRLELINAVDPTLPPADADENRLQQIFHNLIGNAIKFTGKGTIEISAVAGEHLLEVRVADTGRGISDGDLDRIFESFEQGEGSTIREFGGTGLGLAVTKQLV
ncbi:MAG: two-component regulator propeller domain-containing protein, partial [Acidobacteriota bacterium]